MAVFGVLCPRGSKDKGNGTQEYQEDTGEDYDDIAIECHVWFSFPLARTILVVKQTTSDTMPNVSTQGLILSNPSTSGVSTKTTKKPWPPLSRMLESQSSCEDENTGFEGKKNSMIDIV